MKTKTKVRTSFRCQECGHSSARWLGRCPECEHWNSFVEEEEAPPRQAANIRSRALTNFSSDVVRLDDVRVQPLERAATGIAEFDRVLGGGVVPGSLVLLGGPPGIGKSTLMLQVAEGLTRSGSKGLYISGEESIQQVKDRAERLGLKASGLSLVSETEL